MIKPTFTHWLHSEHDIYGRGVVVTNPSLSHTEQRSILTCTINTLPAAILLNAPLLTPIVKAATPFTIGALSCQSLWFLTLHTQYCTTLQYCVGSTIRSHHKPVLEVEREAYWDFESNRAEGQIAFEYRQLEFPKVLSLTIIINTIIIMFMKTRA
jgi:hypothetical protein